MKKIMILGAFIALLSGEVCGSDYIGEMEDLLITPVKTGITAYRWPGTVRIIERERIVESGARTVDQALSQIIGLRSENLTGTTGRGRVDIRGLGENSHLRTLVLIDGKKINRPDMGGVNWLELPLSSVERIEVIHGAGTVLYGNNASGGVINIVTRTPDKERDIYSIAASVGSFSSRGLRASFSPLLSGRNLTLAGDYFSEAGYRDRSASQSRRVSLNYSDSTLPKNMSMNLRGSFTDSFYEMPGSLTEAEAEENPRQALYNDWSSWPPVRAANTADEANEKRGELSAELGIPLSSELSLIFTGGGSIREESVDMASWPSFWDRSMTSINFGAALNLIPGNLYPLTNLLIGGNLGLERLSAAGYLSSDREALTSETDIDMPVYGGYLYAELSPLENLIFSAGYRYEESKISVEQDTGLADGNRRHTGSAVSAGGVFRPFRGLRLFTSASTHYRYPATDEQASYQGWSEGFAGDLDPEGGYNVEGGFNFVQGRLNIDLSAYRRVISEMIAWDNALDRNINMDESVRDGIEGSLSFRASSKINLNGGFSIGRTEFNAGENKGNLIPLIPSYEYTLSGSYKALDWLSFMSDISFFGESVPGGDYSNELDKIPSYSILNASVRVDTPGIIRISGGIRNLLDTKHTLVEYNPWGDDAHYPSYGRNWFINVESVF